MMRSAAILAALLLSTGAMARTTPVQTTPAQTTSVRTTEARAASMQASADKMMATPPPACTAAAPLPAAYASFAHPVASAQGSGVFLGEAATLDLGPGTHFVTPPEHKPAGGTFGGMVGFDVTDPGTYRIAVGAGVWIDVIRDDGGAARSTGHDRGPACTVVKKLVDFTLSPGHYTLQFSGSTTPSVTFQIARVS